MNPSNAPSACLQPSASREFMGVLPADIVPCPHHALASPTLPYPGAGCRRARWNEKLAKITGLGPLFQSWLPRASLYKHQVLKIGRPFQAFPLLPPQHLRISLALFPNALFLCCGFQLGEGLCLRWTVSWEPLLQGLPGPTPPCRPCWISPL